MLISNLSNAVVVAIVAVIVNAQFIMIFGW